jgi:hypothetical protein
MAPAGMTNTAGWGGRPGDLWKLSAARGEIANIGNYLTNLEITSFAAMTAGIIARDRG